MGVYYKVFENLTRLERPRRVEDGHDGNANTRFFVQTWLVPAIPGRVAVKCQTMGQTQSDDNDNDDNDDNDSDDAASATKGHLADTLAPWVTPARLLDVHTTTTP